MSLAHQFVCTNQIWNSLGYANSAPIVDFEERLARRPNHAVTWFHRGVYDRFLFTRRDKSHLFGLPIINGGNTQHMNVPYFPIRFARGFVESIADGKTPQLAPRFTLANDDGLMPLALLRDAKVMTGARGAEISFRQGELDKRGAAAPIKDNLLSKANLSCARPALLPKLTQLHKTES